MILLGRILKSPTFVIQKAATPKNGVEFRQISIGVIRYCLSTLYDNLRRNAMSCDVALKFLRWCLHGDLVTGFGMGQADQYM